MRAGMVIFIVAALVYFFFVRDTRFDIEMPIQDKAYVQAKKISGGGVENYFYTENGVKLEYATEFAQLYVFDDEVPDNTRQIVLDKARKGYGMHKRSEEAESYFGTFSRSGLTMASYGTEIGIDGRPGFAVFLRTIDGADQTSEAQRDVDDIVYDLRNIADRLK